MVPSQSRQLLYTQESEFMLGCNDTHELKRWSGFKVDDVLKLITAAFLETLKLLNSPEGFFNSLRLFKLHVLTCSWGWASVLVFASQKSSGKSSVGTSEIHQIVLC